MSQIVPEVISVLNDRRASGTTGQWPTSAAPTVSRNHADEGAYGSLRVAAGRTPSLSPADAGARVRCCLRMAASMAT